MTYGNPPSAHAEAGQGEQLTTDWSETDRDAPRQTETQAETQTKPGASPPPPQSPG